MADGTTIARGALARLYGDGEANAQFERYESIARRAVDVAGDGELAFFSAPGRTELGGNHTDHGNGLVLAAAVDLDAVAALRPTEDSTVRLESAGFGRALTVDLRDLEPQDGERGRPEALIRGVARALRDSGYRIGGFAGAMASDVKPGSGLSSSACFETLVGAIFSGLFNSGAANWLDIARSGRRAENEFFGKPCGLMDQIACARGGVMAVDFAEPAAPAVREIATGFFDSTRILAVVDSGGSHSDLTADYAALPAEMRAVAAYFGLDSIRSLDRARVLESLREIRQATGDRAVLRALHYFAENERVVAMADALEKDDAERFLALVRESGESSWKLAQNLYAPDRPREQGIALAIEASRSVVGDSGAFRVHGGGFAGTMQAYVPAESWERWLALMESAFGAGCARPLRVRNAGAIEVYRMESKAASRLERGSTGAGQ